VARADHVLWVGMVAGVVTFGGATAHAVTNTWSSGVLCVQNNDGIDTTGTLRQAIYAGSANSNTASQLIVDCPVPRASPWYWIELSVGVYNAHPTDYLRCDYRIIGWDGSDIFVDSGLAPRGGWTLTFQNEYPYDQDPDSFYTLECFLPKATGSGFSDRSRVMGFNMVEC